MNSRRAHFYAAELVKGPSATHHRCSLTPLSTDYCPRGPSPKKHNSPRYQTRKHTYPRRRAHRLGRLRFFEDVSPSHRSRTKTGYSRVIFGADSDSDTGSFLKPTPRVPDAIIRYPTTEVCGTPYYMAPEQHYGEKHSFKVDFWGMGVTLYRMLTNRMGHKVSFQCDYCRWDLKPQMPFGVDAVHKNEMAASVARDPLVFEAKDGVDQTTQAFLRGLLAKDPRDRLSLEEIKTHPYFDGM